MLKSQVEHFHTQMYRNYKEMHPTFWNSLSLIDHNFGTKSPFELKQKHSKANISQFLCIRQRKPWTPPPQGSTQIRRRDDIESWGVYFQGLVNLDLINFLTMRIFTLCEFRPGESWTNAVYISSENVLSTKTDYSKNVFLIVVLVKYKLKWMCC